MLSRQPPRYSGKCSALTAADQNTFEKEGRSSTLRFRIERNRTISVSDHIRGELIFDTNTLDDFIIAKDFDTPLYNFAVVIDDHLMKISHIIRGEEHISNVPKQVLLAEALGFSTPEFVHLPLILNPDRTKLSKRQNKVSLLEYRTDGYLSEALINFMVLLGWNPGGDREIFTLAELEQIFDLTRVNKSGSIFDTNKLDWFNAHYIREMDISKLASLCKPYLVSAGYITEKKGASKQEDGKLEKIVDLERERMHKISEISLHTSYFFLADIEYDDHLLLWKNTSSQATQEGIHIAEKALHSLDESDFTPSQIEEKLKQAIVEAKLKNGVVLWPLRVSLTGLAASPSPFDVAAILGKKKTLERISHALKRISSLRP